MDIRSDTRVGFEWRPFLFFVVPCDSFCRCTISSKDRSTVVFNAEGGIAFLIVVCRFIYFLFNVPGGQNLKNVPLSLFLSLDDPPNGGRKDWRVLPMLPKCTLLYRYCLCLRPSCLAFRLQEIQPLPSLVHLVLQQRCLSKQCPTSIRRLASYILVVEVTRHFSDMKATLKAVSPSRYREGILFLSHYNTV